MIQLCARALFVMFVLFQLSADTFGQVLTQTVRGRITDRVTTEPVSSVDLQVIGADKVYDVKVSEDGVFSVEVPVGRYRIRAFAASYDVFEDELLVISGREHVISIGLLRIERTLQSIEVTSSQLSEEVPGARSLSIEKTLRIPANFFDPVRVITAYPSVVAANDQGNSIIVRGNSPNGLLWRLNGLDIVNPNHLANAGTLSDIPAANGGGVNVLSAQVLDRTDFYVGGFPARFGNALSGIVDMSFREGHKEDTHFTAQASLIGLDVAAEGPIGSKKKSSYLVNYRYSTVGLLAAMGVNLGDEEISFNDLSFHVDTDLNNGGNISLFGIYGRSANNFESKPVAEWEEDKDRYNINYTSQTSAIGINFFSPLGKGKIAGGLASSFLNQERRSSASGEFPDLRHLEGEQFDSDIYLLSLLLNYQVKATSWSFLEFGSMANYLNNDLSFLRNFGCQSCPIENPIARGGQYNGILMQPYINWSADFTRAISLDAGIRYVNFGYNQSSNVEPRVALHLKPSAKNRIDLAYSMTSQIQQPFVYVSENENLGLTKSHHFDATHAITTSTQLLFTTNIFYQSLYDIPIESIPSSTFSAINMLEGFAPPDLVNEGTGKNYGIDITVERKFYTSHYFLVGGALYESKYTPADGVERDTRFNGNYTLNATYGKEWLRPKKNSAVSLNTRLLYLGGMREHRVDVATSQFTAETQYDDNNPFSVQLPDYFRVDLRLSFRKNKPRHTRTFSIDIQNVTNQQNEAFHYYDFTQQKIVTKYQLGIIPVLSYRWDF